MANEMRDRLTEYIENAKKLYEGDVTDLSESEYIAECLLSDGMIVPPYIESNIIVLPCRVGQTVYRTSGNFGGEKIYKGVIDQIGIYDGRETRLWVHGHPLSFTCTDIGKTVFLTKDQAEQKLKEMRGGNG